MHALSLSLSLSLSLYSLFLNWTPLSLSVSLFSPFSHSFSKTTNPDHFFTGSFLHWLIQILSSLADQWTKLQRPRSFLHRRPKSFLFQKLPTQITSSPGSFFTGRSTNQAPQPRSFLHRLIHELSSTTQITSSSADPRTKLHKHRSISLLVCLCGFVCVWVCFCVDLSVWMCLCASEEKRMRS